MNEKWFKDLMVQSYHCDAFYDPTKLLFCFSLCSTALKQSYSLDEVSRIVYRYYCVNKEIALNNVNILVRNVWKYGVLDLQPIVASSIKEFIKEQLSNSISFNGEFIVLNIDDYGDKALSLTQALCATLFKKYFKLDLKPIPSLKYVCELDDKNIYEFGKCLLRQRVLEDYQYCPICEETDIDNLYIVHIYSKDDGATFEELTDKDNCLLMCKNECEDYIAGKFYIDEFGKIINVSSKFIQPGMRISLKILNAQRRNYLKRKKDIMEN